jgi:IclR family KDG regulon transcriptional repressor
MTRVVERVLSLMECFDISRPALPLQEIAKRAGLAKATAFRLLATLVKEGYMVQLGNQEYCLSPKIMRLAAVAQRNFSIRDVARPVMIDVLSKSGETVDLSVLSGTARVCVDVLESPHPLRRIISAGDIVELHLAASGKVLIASNPGLIDRLIVEKRLKLDRKTLDKELRKIRDNGYSYTSGERLEGADAISVPIRDHLGNVRYCLTLAGPSSRFAPRRQEFIVLMKHAGKTISEALGALTGTAGTAA